MDIGRTGIIPLVEGEDSGGEGGKGGKAGGDGGGSGSRGGGGFGEGTGAQSSRVGGGPATAGPGPNRLRAGAGSAVSVVGWNGFSEMAWKRRHANDPAMMRELKRYQKLMLLTILPAISGGESAGDTQHQGLQHPSNASFYNEDSNSDDEEEEESFRETDDNHNEHLPKPEPTDAIAAPRGQLSPQFEKYTRLQNRAKRLSHSSSSSSNESTHLPLTVYNPLNASPKRKGRRKSKEELRRRKSYAGDIIRDERKEVAEVGSFGGSPGSSNSAGNEVTPPGGTAGELDLLTLAALYLESRHRVFGKEWHYRSDGQGNARPAGQVGTTGISRPRRLTPLSPNRKTPPAQETPIKRPFEHRRSFSGVIPAPAGLHLSVNYTQNLDLDESSFFAERARALKPRLRRLNSLDDITTGSSSNSEEQSIYRATSAPDLSQSGHTKHLNSMFRNDSQTSLESISPPPVTPARANTPTGAKHSAALTRPQIVGGSLATYSAVERSPPPSSKMRSLSSSLGANYQSNKDTRKTSRAFSEGSGSSLLQPPPWGHPAPEYKNLEVPSAPPPSAMADVHRKNGRIHLQPLTIRKASS